MTRINSDIDPTRLSRMHLLAKLEQLLESPHPNMGKISDWTDGTIDRCLDIIEGCGEKWRRDGCRYRTFAIQPKY